MFFGKNLLEGSMERESIVLGVGFTNICNMNCDFCYSKNNREYSFRQPLHVWKDFFMKNGPYLKSINYGTGENALEDDWFELIEFIADTFPHITQAVTTNGSLAHILESDKNKERVFLKAIEEVDVSLDYVDVNKHNSIRGNVNAFKWAIETLKFCTSTKRRLTVVTIGLNETLEISNIEGIFEIAQRFDALNRINIYRKSIDRIDECELDYDILMTFLEWVSQNHTIVELSDPLFSSIFNTNEVTSDASGKSSFRIVADGRIYPSTYLLYDGFLLGNITDTNFAFDNVKNDFFLSQIVIPDGCQNCHYCNQCKGGAIDRRYLWYRSFNEPDPYCPNRHLESRSYDIKANTCNMQCNSVHKGYLPTLFFKGGK